jgi:hypothetical protein
MANVTNRILNEVKYNLILCSVTVCGNRLHCVSLEILPADCPFSMINVNVFLSTFEIVTVFSQIYSKLYQEENLTTRPRLAVVSAEPSVCDSRFRSAFS